MKKNLLKFCLLFAIGFATAIFTSCESKEIEIGELSPPSWLQGEWKKDGFVYEIYFKFTPNNVIFALPYESVASFSEVYGNYTITESVKTNDSYEITVTRNQYVRTYHFRRGDNRTYIQQFVTDTEIGIYCIAISILHRQ